DAVAPADLAHLPALPREAAAAHHIKDLLVEPVLVGRGRPPASGYLEPAHPDLDAPGRLAYVCPATLDVAEGVLAHPRVVQVSDPHAGDSTTAGRSGPAGARRSTRRAA